MFSVKIQGNKTPTQVNNLKKDPTTDKEKPLSDSLPFGVTPEDAPQVAYSAITKVLRPKLSHVANELPQEVARGRSEKMVASSNSKEQ